MSVHHRTRRYQDIMDSMEVDQEGDHMDHFEDVITPEDEEETKTF